MISSFMSPGSATEPRPPGNHLLLSILGLENIGFCNLLNGCKRLGLFNCLSQFPYSTCAGLLACLSSTLFPFAKASLMACTVRDSEKSGPSGGDAISPQRRALQYSAWGIQAQVLAAKEQGREGLGSCGHSNPLFSPHLSLAWPCPMLILLQGVGGGRTVGGPA